MDASVVSYNASPAAQRARDSYAYPRPSGESMATSKAPVERSGKQPKLKLVLPKTKRSKKR